MKETITKRINFDKTGYFAMGLVVLAILGIAVSLLYKPGEKKAKEAA